MYTNSFGRMVNKHVTFSPSHIPYAFVVKVKNNIHIVNIDYNAVYACYGIKIF